MSAMTGEFTIGDKAVYPSQGVAEVVGIEKKEVYGKIQNFYVLRGLETGLRILVPIDKADQVGLRKVAGRAEIEEVLFRHPAVAEVFRDLYRLKGLKALSFGERRMLDTAKGLIVQELSVARASDTQKVEQELEQIFG